jgi:hypothetical protein
LTKKSTITGANAGVVGPTICISGFGVLGIAGTPCTVPLASRGSSAQQTANLQEWQKGCGAQLAVVNNKGWLGIGTPKPRTSLEVMGSLSAKVAIVSSNYSMTDVDFGILANASSGALAVTLPPANTSLGMLAFIKKVDTSTNTVNVVPAGTDLIQGKSSESLVSAYASLYLISDGSSNWYTVANETS